MQIQVNKFLVLLTAIVTLGAAGCATDTSQNNATNNSNQTASGKNTSNQNTPNQNTPANTATPKPIVCNGVNQQNIKDEINNLPPALKNQFKEANPAAGTISVNYDAAASEMTFQGYLTSDGTDLSLFFNQFNKFRGRQCVKTVYFQGATDKDNFEWRPATTFTPPPPGNCKANVENTINNSSFSSQLNKNLNFSYDDKTGVLTLTGYFADIPTNNGQLSTFLAALEKLVTAGCVSKIVFKGQAKSGESPLSERNFGWTLCEPPLVECAGECVASCPTPSPITAGSPAAK